MSELFNILAHAVAPIGTPTGKPRRRAEPIKSAIPYELPFDDSSGCMWEFDYTYEIDCEREIDVNITAVRLRGNGPEIEVPMGHVSSFWLRGIEDDIAEEVLAELTATAEALHRDPSDDGDYSYDAMLDKRGPR